MLTFWGVVAAASVLGGLPTVGGLWMFERWRSRRRNGKGQCATCGAGWDSTPAGEPYLIHGRLVCQGCAEKARRRLPWHFAILGLAAGIGTAFAVSSAGLVTIILLPVTSTIAMTVGAVDEVRQPQSPTPNRRR